MTDMVAPGTLTRGEGRRGVHTTTEADARLRKRYAAELRFKLYGLAAVSVAILALVVLLASILHGGVTAFLSTQIRLDVEFDPSVIDAKGGREALLQADWAKIVDAALEAKFPEATSRPARRALSGLVSPGAQQELRDMVIADPALIGQKRTVWLIASSDVDMFMKGYYERPKAGAAEGGRVNERSIAWIDRLVAEGAIEKRFNTRFFTAADSREPELVGVWGGIVGSFFTLLITLALAFPIGVAGAIYLEEFAPKNRFTDLIEVNINNLAAVPSIVYGLLGLAVFINAFGMPRSAPLVGGCVLALMSLPIIIIAGRAALKAVPPSIREAALGDRRLAHADGAASRPAAGHAGHADRHHPVDGARARRDGAAADDRHGGLRRRHSDQPAAGRHGAAGPDLHVGRPSGARLHREDLGGDHRAAGLPAGDERCRHLPAQEIRKEVVR